MKNIIILLMLIFFVLPANAGKYGLFTPNSYNYDANAGEKLLFILDLSNSMNESLENDTKFNLMLKTMRDILPKIPQDTQIGLRIYGYKMGFTPVEACRASTLAVPIAAGNGRNIENSLMKRKPRGMTPITFSLKQAIKYDFANFIGLKHIILMTDGGENCDESPCTFVMELIKFRRDVKIDVIAFNIKDYEDLQQLRCTALVTSGQFYNAQTSSQLAQSFNKTINGVKNVEAKILLPDFK
jgi:hypothetical protein